MTLYNPHLLARQDLIETFVARQPLLHELIDDLRRGGGQHHLLVGGRGTGKTTLLLRLAAALEDDKQLAKKCIPLRFPEEQYNVSRPSDFWMNAIDALVDALERQGDRAAAKRLESCLTELEPLEEDVRAKRSLAILEGWAKQARRLIVLLADNLDLVLDRLAGSLWDLREALSIDNGLVVIGASSKFLEEAIDYQSPLYDFFHVHELGPLSEDEARRLVLSLAQRANTPRVAEILERDPGRFKALYVLTGGTPRTLALLHTVLALEHSERIERDLDGLLDQLTPYYKARFDDLPSQSQVIVDKVALHWHPITAAECQAATHLDVNLVSAQLSRLVKNGLLTKVSLPGPSKLGFRLSERFFNIWYLMRASRRLRRRLSWFVEFLRIFYGEEDLRHRAEELIRAAPPNDLNSPAKFLAFASAVPDEALRRRLEFRAISLLAEEGVTTIREVMDLEGEDLHLVPIIDRVRALREIPARLARARIHWPAGYTADSVAEKLVRHPTLSIHQKQAISVLLERGNTSVLQKFLRNSSDDMGYLGQRLLSAISTGEIPALCDIRTPGEMRQIVELAELPPHAVAMTVVCSEITNRAISDDIIHQIWISNPSATRGIILAADLLIGNCDWTRIRHLVLSVIPRAVDSIPLAQLIIFLETCIANNLTSEAMRLVVDSGMAEQWAPLYEALCAVSEGSAERLERLAPEMRVITLAVYDKLRRRDAGPALDKSGGIATKAPIQSQVPPVQPAGSTWISEPQVQVGGRRTSRNLGRRRAPKKERRP